jgi:hypothetical protein
MKRVFISYSHDDESVARELKESLHNTEVLGWMDQADIAAGEAVSRKVKESLRQASAVIVLVSERSLMSQWVQFEIGAALAMEKLIIPVLIGRAGSEPPLPDWLRGIRYIDARQRPVRNAAEEVTRALSEAGPSTGQ